MPTLDLTTETRGVDKAEARRADLDARHESRALTVAEVQASNDRNAPGWGRYVCETTPRDVRRAYVSLPDPRRLTLGRLYVDCGRAASRFAPKYHREDRATLQADAVLWILEHETQGDAAIPIGAAGETPLRRVWIDRDTGDLTHAAWKVLRAAMNAARDAPAMRATMAERETVPVAASVSDANALDIGALAAQERAADTDNGVTLPDADAPAVLADILGISLAAARAIVARLYPALSMADLAASWSVPGDTVTVGTVKNALSGGAAEVRRRWPGADLLRDLRSASAIYAQRLEADASLALLDYRDGYGTETRAADAVARWRRCQAGANPAALALLAAARGACQRAGRGRVYASDYAERVALSVERIIPAESARARRRVPIASSPLPTRASAGERVSLARVAALRPNVREPLSWRTDDARKDAAQRLDARDHVFPKVYAWRYRSAPPTN